MVVGEVVPVVLVNFVVDAQCLLRADDAKIVGMFGGVDGRVVLDDGAAGVGQHAAGFVGIACFDVGQHLVNDTTGQDNCLRCAAIQGCAFYLSTVPTVPVLPTVPILPVLPTVPAPLTRAVFDRVLLPGFRGRGSRGLR